MWFLETDFMPLSCQALWIRSHLGLWGHKRRIAKFSFRRYLTPGQNPGFSKKTRILLMCNSTRIRHVRRRAKLYLKKKKKKMIYR